MSTVSRNQRQRQENASLLPSQERGLQKIHILPQCGMPGRQIIPAFPEVNKTVMEFSSSTDQSPSSFKLSLALITNVYTIIRLFFLSVKSVTIGRQQALSIKLLIVHDRWE
ncbi:Hypothetical predicted protein [Podarcis lilfordi]|uniref:Uncharacterized protein n=1 Tax=Podarcis lilfordi TaxID=74358 RepID=A0AA35JXZ4_9SAUR|nr:Hypothetical predicted protein [Podarcis lilfordi]